MERVIAHSLEAEQAVVGGIMLLGSEGIDRVGDILSPSDFYRREHRLIYAAMVELSDRNEPLDPLTIGDELVLRKELENAGGSSYIVDLATSVPSAANIRAHAKIVKDRAVTRQLLEASNDIAEMCFSESKQSIGEKINIAQQKVMDIQLEGEDRPEPKPFYEASKSAIELMNHRFESGSEMIGVSTGLIDLDKITLGLPKKDYILLAGRPSMGKSTLALNFAEAVAKDGNLTVFFSLEMDIDSLMLRIYSNQANIPIQDVRKGNLESSQWDNLSRTISKLKSMPLYIDETSSVTPSMIRARTRRIQRKANKPVGMIVIDYIQLMRSNTKMNSREQEIAEISRSLKAIAKEFDCPVVALSQLNRGLESRPADKRRPMTSDLRESGSLEQDADIILFVYRDVVYNENTLHPNTAELLIAKQRNGNLGRVYTTADLGHCRFLDYCKEEISPKDQTSPAKNKGLTF